MAVKISPQAFVDPHAELADGVEVGAFSWIGPHVRIGEGTIIHNNVTLTGWTTIGRGNQIHANAVIGGEPQDLSYHGTPTRVVIGDQNVIREAVTINRGTEKERGLTSVGSHCYFMACSHVAHDCVIGDHVIMANGTLLGGHVHVQDHASLSGGVAVHHFATIGSYSFIGGVSRLLQDAPPFMLLEGVPARPRCVNVVALKRNSFTRETIDALAETHRLLYRARVGLDNAREILRGNGRLLPQVNYLLSFVECQHEGRHGRSRDVRRAA